MIKYINSYIKYVQIHQIRDNSREGCNFLRIICVDRDSGIIEGETILYDYLKYDTSKINETWRIWFCS